MRVVRRLGKPRKIGKFIEQNNTRGPELRFRGFLALTAIPVASTSNFMVVAAGIGVVRAPTSKQS